MANKAVKKAVMQALACDTFKKKRIARIEEMEEAYYGKVRPNLKGRSNIPIPILAKYVDEIKSRLDENPTPKIGHKRDSQILVARKVQSASELDADPNRGDWARKDRMQRILAIFSGIGIYDSYAESEPEYKFNLDIVDVRDFYFEPTGGSDLEQHAYVGKANIFRTKAHMERMAEAGIYDKDQVEKLITKSAALDYKAIQKPYLSRFTKYRALGLDMEHDQYIGDDFYPLAQWQLEMEDGERYFMIWDMLTETWLRFEPLKDVFASGRYSMTMWQTHEDPNTVLSKSPVDDFMPIVETFRLKMNQLIDNHTKRIWGQRAYDPRFFPDPAQLEWSRPDQLVLAKAYEGKPISSGVYEFKTEDATVGTIDLLKFLEGLLASVAGVTPADATDNQQKVGVLFGNLQKASARLGVYNKSYNECWQKNMFRYIWGLKEHLTKPMAVKLLGEGGVEWEELANSELGADPDFEIAIVGSNVELEMNEAKKKKQGDALTDIVNNPELLKEINAKFVVEEKLRIAGFPEEAIRRGMDTKNYGNETIISHAAMAIEKILKGKQPDLYEGADVTFMQYILDYTRDNNLKDEQMNAMLNYGAAHQQIVIRNMTQKAMLAGATNLAMPNGGAPVPGADPAAPGGPGGAPALPVPNPNPGVGAGVNASNVARGI